MARTLIAACGGPAVAQVRKTFPVTPDPSPTALLQRRGRLLSHEGLALAELPPLPEAGSDALELTAELAFYLGHCRECTAVLLMIPAQRLTLADRIIAPEKRELIPDLLEPASRIDASVTVAAIDNPAVWAAAQWALRRLGPHQFWVVGLPVEARQPRGGVRSGRRADGRTADEHQNDAPATGLHPADTHAPDPPPARPASDSATHRGLRSVVAALEEQTR